MCVCVRVCALQAAYEILEHRRTARMAAAVVRLQAFLRGARSVSQSASVCMYVECESGRGWNQSSTNGVRTAEPPHHTIHLPID